MHFSQHKTLLALFVFFAMTPFSAFAADNCAALARNLNVGMKGDDVLLLQKVLNKTIGIRIADSGPGAPGEETTYFGAKTKLAVIQFQNLYRNEVLIPVGLLSGTGYVGSMTRAKLMTVCVGETAKSVTPQIPISELIPPPKHVPPPASVPVKTPPAATSTTLLPSPSAIAFAEWVNAPDAPLELFYANTKVLSPGDKLRLTGRGFAATGNAVHIGALVIDNITPEATNTIALTVPANAPKGKFDLWISNAKKGESNKQLLVVKDPAASPPAIISYTPKSGPLGTIVVVTGTGFTAKNDIHLSNRTITDIPSTDGKTLSFPMETPEIPGSYAGFDMPGVDEEIPFWFYVVNANGMSQGGVFNVKI